MIRVESGLSEAYSNWSELGSVLVWRKNVPCPMRFSCPAQGWYSENKSVKENRQMKMFAGITQSFAMLLYRSYNLFHHYPFIKQN